MIEKKVIIDCIINKSELNTISAIYDMIYYKLYNKEHISKDIINEICIEVKNNINEIIRLFLLSESDLDDNIQYIGY